MMVADILKIRLLLLVFLIPLNAFPKDNCSGSSPHIIKPKHGKPAKSIINPDSDNKRPADTLYLFRDNQLKQLHVDVLKITYNSVFYREPGDSVVKKIHRKEVHKIRYDSGKLEILNAREPEMVDRFNWKKVIILENKKETEGLYSVEKIQAKAKGSGRGHGTPSSLENSARIILKKKATNLNAKYVLITNKSVTAPFGGIPSVTVTGIAYSDERKSAEGKKTEGKQKPGLETPQE